MIFGIDTPSTGNNHPNSAMSALGSLVIGVEAEKLSYFWHLRRLYDGASRRPSPDTLSQLPCLRPMTDVGVFGRGRELRRCHWLVSFNLNPGSVAVWILSHVSTLGVRAVQQAVEHGIPPLRECCCRAIEKHGVVSEQFKRRSHGILNAIKQLIKCTGKVRGFLPKSRSEKNSIYLKFRDVASVHDGALDNRLHEPRSSKKN